MLCPYKKVSGWVVMYNPDPSFCEVPVAQKNTTHGMCECTHVYVWYVSVWYVSVRIVCICVVCMWCVKASVSMCVCACVVVGSQVSFRAHKLADSGSLAHPLHASPQQRDKV